VDARVTRADTRRLSMCSLLNGAFAGRPKAPCVARLARWPEGAAIERRLLRLRAEGQLGDAGWADWLAVREGARHYGGYEPVATPE